jgi:TetR/AcrR family transcriptional regulator, cholesterol catabolism regulator
MTDIDDKQVDRRSEILHEAAKIIASKGYASATVRDIADASGILSGSLYHHFDSKDQMLVEILQSMLSEITESYRRIAEENREPRDAIEELMATGFQALDKWQVEIRILQNDFPYLSKIKKFDFIGAAQSEIESIWTSQLRRGVSDGTFQKTMNVGLVYRIMMGSVLSAGRWFIRGRTQSSLEIGREHASIFLIGLLNSKNKKK